MPMRTCTAVPSGQSRAASARCAASAAASAALASAKAMKNSSARQSTSWPSASATASRTSRRCSERTCAYSSPSFWTRVVEPSMSEKRRVTSPVGGLLTLASLRRPIGTAHPLENGGRVGHPRWWTALDLRRKGNGDEARREDATLERLDRLGGSRRCRGACCGRLAAAGAESLDSVAEHHRQLVDLDPDLLDRRDAGSGPDDLRLPPLPRHQERCRDRGREHDELHVPAVELRDAVQPRR